MEAVVAHEVAARMRLAGLPVQRAVEEACAVVQGTSASSRSTRTATWAIAATPRSSSGRWLSGTVRCAPGLVGTDSIR